MITEEHAGYLIGLPKRLIENDQVSENAKEVLGDDMLRSIAVEVAQKIKANATIDWTIRESARAKMMAVVRRILNKYGYPPDKQQRAIDTVLKQTTVTADWVVEEL